MASAAAATAQRAGADESEDLWNLIFMYSEVAKAQLREFHQQVELFVHETGAHPVSGATGLGAAHDGATLPPLRERTLPAHVAPLPLVSDAVATLTRELCAPSGAVRDAGAMAQLTKRLDATTTTTLSVDDRAQLLFVLDASFSLAPATAAILLSAFEKDGGYGVLAAWLEHASAVGDDPHKALSLLLLQFLARHRPALAYSRKATLLRLRQALPAATGRKVKALLKDVIDKYKLPA